MSNYSKSTNFATKDNLTPGDPLKIVRGTEIDTEFNNIATAIATKTDNASAAIAGGTINDTTIGATTASTGAFTTLAASGAVTLSGGTANGVAYLNGSKVLTSGSALTFDGSNLGLGVTPSASTLPTIQSTYGVLSGNTNISILRNAYYNSGWKYTATGAATFYQHDGGSHIWYNAPSGTAGNAITFTQALTLTADGNLVAGATSSDFRLATIVQSGADRDLFMAAVNGVTNGFTVKWNHATSKIRVNIQNLPTSSSGLSTGDLWNDGGTLKIA